jgi:hypothetical protein
LRRAEIGFTFHRIKIQEFRLIQYCLWHFHQDFSLIRMVGTPQRAPRILFPPAAKDPPDTECNQSADNALHEIGK